MLYICLVSAWLLLGYCLIFAQVLGVFAFLSYLKKRVLV